MIELLTLYLDVAKLDAGLTEVKAQSINLAQSIRAEVEEQSALILVRHIEVTINVPKEIMVETSPNLFSRVVENVLNNAVKFTPKGGKVEVSARIQDADVFLSIKDSGPGISAEDLPYIFDRYYQAKVRQAGQIEGTGLGLTFCREALRAMKAEINVHSILGQGSEFIIRLPLTNVIKTNPGNSRVPS